MRLVSAVVVGVAAGTAWDHLLVSEDVDVDGSSYGQYVRFLEDVELKEMRDGRLKQMLSSNTPIQMPRINRNPMMKKASAPSSPKDQESSHGLRRSDSSMHLAVSDE